ncbi:hypothetical protein DPMN_178696 [Dreissena polymorpha]|uniref:Uncharacterized protein n=1 Tax=Dreissena polymorpha TaxID=45954 RepID=A0A9D4ECN3_DREPO|nr:hypothetical protein DPMN_178696 [Dreissena polymorpha]
MREELDEIDDMIQTMMLVVRDCNIRLGKIALCPNPLSMTQHIDFMIESETMEKKDGWYERVQTLYRFRKRARVVNDAESFFKEAINLGVTGNRRKYKKKTYFKGFVTSLKGKDTRMDSQHQVVVKRLLLKRQVQAISSNKLMTVTSQNGMLPTVIIKINNIISTNNAHDGLSYLKKNIEFMPPCLSCKCCQCLNRV